MTGKIAERLSSIFHWSTDRVGEPGYPFTSLNQVIYGMETLARSAMSVEQFIEGLREVLEVSDKHPVPEVGVRTPSLTVVDLSPSGNGWFIDARFQSGERFKLAINKASIGWAADPPEPTRDKEVMRLLSGLKGARVSTDEDLALLAMEVAHYSSDIAGWLAGPALRHLWGAEALEGAARLLPVPGRSPFIRPNPRTLRAGSRACRRGWPGRRRPPSPSAP